MYKCSLKNFFFAKTTHRIPKILALVASSSVLVAMVNIDASASAFGGRDSSSVRSDVVLTLASESNSQFSGLVKRWATITSISTSTAPVVTATAPTGGGTGGGGGGTGSGGGNSGIGSSGGGAGSGSGSGSSAATTTTTTAPPTTTTTSPPTTTTTPSNSGSSSSGGLITAGASRSECLEPSFSDTGFASLQSAVSSFDTLTHSTVTCLNGYLNGAQNWQQWTNPWISTPGYGYTDWIAQEPQTRQLVLQVDLIPDSLENVGNPLGWEQSCANGDFNTYATELGQNLVAAGLQNSVIRLGAEMNGAWEADFVGSTTQEQNLWATCFANEVTGLRQAAGENFLIDWNPNAATQNIPYQNFYPGDAYVDILGLDQYDASSLTSGSFTFSQMAAEPAGLDAFEAFAAAHGKPMSFPEWGLYQNYPGDDPGFVDGIGSTVNNGNFAFESFYDVGDDNTLTLGPNAPLSLTEFEKWFGNS